MQYNNNDSVSKPFLGEWLHVCMYFEMTGDGAWEWCNVYHAVIVHRRQ